MLPAFGIPIGARGAGACRRRRRGRDRGAQCRRSPSRSSRATSPTRPRPAACSCRSRATASPRRRAPSSPTPPRPCPNAKIDGVLVSEMAQGVEALIGVVNDASFGPVVALRPRRRADRGAGRRDLPHRPLRPRDRARHDRRAARRDACSTAIAASPRPTRRRWRGRSSPSRRWPQRWRRGSRRPTSTHCSLGRPASSRPMRSLCWGQTLRV